VNNTEDERYEIKFVLNENELTELGYWLKMVGAFEAYSSRTIISLYFDNIK